ncbi:predicted protein [Lichtheimia corymbifera JMRC:FSU:9682]|uniref:Uncharacterized protein n=1 Tax=Lichtheimia corymbifera JMRC:FSU:9682 TaxID=1263082 RepID=A0A068SFJ6_9FUNG|nr:predicted protein [Lichtheimia corymbifera JMRC:FSU:9682]
MHITGDISILSRHEALPITGNSVDYLKRMSFIGWSSQQQGAICLPLAQQASISWWFWLSVSSLMSARCVLRMNHVME